MIKKKMPQRKCTGCGTVKNKKELIRIVRSPENEVFVDATGKKSGRGVYVCFDAGCLKKTRKSKRIERALEVDISEEIFDILEKTIAETANSEPSAADSVK